MALPRLRESLFHGIAVALAAPPVLALADAAARAHWFADGMSISWLVALPFLLIGAAFLGAPLSVPAGALGGLALSWWPGQVQLPANLRRDGAVVGGLIGTGMLAALSAVDSSGWGNDSGTSGLFPLVGGLCGWLAAGATFPDAPPNRVA